MIVSLEVRNFALFAHVSLDLQQGMTVFTGETGAGKSILVDALGAVFGARANTDWVRHGADKAEVVAEIESQDTRLRALLDAQDIEADASILIRRVITAEGRSKAWVNGTPVAASLLKQLGQVCFDLHGQHEHQRLLQPGFQQGMIDARVPPQTLHAVQMAYDKLCDINKRLRDLHGNRDEARAKEAWMREELARLSALDIEEGLEDKLEAECEAGRNIEQVQQAAAGALNLLDEQDICIRTLLTQSMHHITAVSEHHPALQEACDLLAQMDALTSEITPHLQAVLDTRIDSQSLQHAEDRLADLRAAMRRHHTDEAGLLALMQQWEATLSALDTAAWDEEALQAEQAQAETSYNKAATALHEARVSAADTLIRNLRPFLDQLGLKNMQLSAQIQARQDKSTWKADGWDDIQLLAAANIGEPFKSLADTASGGELSRMVLALKGCGALENEPDTAVFDEVDVGIGGETGWCVGELLRRMGHQRQVFVVSHLPQVAACAHTHIAIEKVVDDGRTRTELRPLPTQDKPREIARMLGGVSEESLKHAQAMLQRGQQAS